MTAEGMYREGRVIFGAKLAYAEQEFEKNIDNEQFEEKQANTLTPEKEQMSEPENQRDDSYQ